jgi:hypothetical protein
MAGPSRMLEAEIRRRAAGHWKYCHFPEAARELPFHIEGEVNGSRASWRTRRVAIRSWVERRSAISAAITSGSGRLSDSSRLSPRVARICRDLACPAGGSHRLKKSTASVRVLFRADRFLFVTVLSVVALTKLARCERFQQAAASAVCARRSS